jgi:hypothetical protein
MYLLTSERSFWCFQLRPDVNWKVTSETRFWYASNSREQAKSTISFIFLQIKVSSNSWTDSVTDLTWRYDATSNFRKRWASCRGWFDTHVPPNENTARHFPLTHPRRKTKTSLLITRQPIDRGETGWQFWTSFVSTPLHMRSHASPGYTSHDGQDTTTLVDCVALSSYWKPGARLWIDSRESFFFLARSFSSTQWTVRTVITTVRHTSSIFVWSAQQPNAGLWWGFSE